MRIHGRVLRPSTLAERRVMNNLGVSSIRVPRKHNPYVVARRLARLARFQCPDGQYIRDVIERMPRPVAPHPSPEPDTNEPIEEHGCPAGRAR